MSSNTVLLSRRQIEARATLPKDDYDLEGSRSTSLRMGTCNKLVLTDLYNVVDLFFLVTDLPLQWDLGL